MKNLGTVSFVLVVLGVLALSVPVPQSDAHGVIQTGHSEKLPPAIGTVLLVSGVLILGVGALKAR
jgi:hypothetical protein